MSGCIYVKWTSLIDEAKELGADIVVLPEYFYRLYGRKEKSILGENIPTGESCVALSNAAKKNRIYVIGGTIPEKSGDKVFNTCTVWNPEGELIAEFRKIHLFDIDIKGTIQIFETKTTDPGSELATFEAKGWKIGLGVCHDLRFEEMAKLYRKQGCHLLIYPGAFNTFTGPIQYSLLGRSRANENQLYVACVSPARAQNPLFTIYGHTYLVNPWGEVLAELDHNEGTILKDINMKVVEDARAHIRVFDQRRTDIYDTVDKKAETSQ